MGSETMRFLVRTASSFCCLLACTNNLGCSSSDTSNGAEQTQLEPEVCDETKRPILFVHGIMGGGDNFEVQAERFTSNGYCRSAIRAYDYDATYLAFGGALPSD